MLFLHGRSGMYLEPAPGEAGITNILKMARDGLRRELTTMLHKVVSAQTQMSALGLRVKTNGHHTLVNLTVCPVVHGNVAAQASPLYLVILEQAPPASAVAGPSAQLPAKLADGPVLSRDATAQIRRRRSH